MAFETATRSTGLYSTPRWKAIRRAVLSAEPYCRTCRSDGKLTTATFVDHIHAPHTSDERAFWAASIGANLQPLCRAHSNAKTGHEVAARMSRKREPEPHPGLR